MRSVDRTLHGLSLSERVYRLQPAQAMPPPGKPRPDRGEKIRPFQQENCKYFQQPHSNWPLLFGISLQSRRPLMPPSVSKARAGRGPDIDPVLFGIHR